MDFIKQLEEARLTRNTNNLKSLTYTDCCERAFLILLILDIMKHYPEFRSVASRYAEKTLEKSDYSQFRAFGTDLYNFIYFITGDEDAINKLKDPESAMVMRERTTFPVFAVNRYLRSLSSSRVLSDTPKFFVNIESILRITNSDYKALRRNVVNYTSLTLKQRKATVTKLLFAARAKLRSSDIIDDFSRLAADRDLESEKVKDTEPEVSVPDRAPLSQELAYYRLLVGTENLGKLRLFLELLEKGNSIPAPIIDGYRPILDMIDDIIKGGPMYIRLLQQVHQKAKKNT